MSGPKVVHIVTREEIEALCCAHIALVDAAVARVIATLKKYDMATDEKRAELLRQRSVLKQSLDTEKFLEVQKLAPALVDFCTTEIARIHQRAADEAEAARNRGRRVADAARSIIALREKQKLPVSEHLRAVVRKAGNAAPQTLDEMQFLLNQALSEVAKAGMSTDMSREAEELAGRLGAGGAPQTLEDWLKANPPAVNEKVRRLDKVLAELKVLAAPTLYETFASRAADIAGEAEPSRVNLLTDSLILDASTAVTNAKELEVLRVRVEKLGAELSTLPVETALLDRVRSVSTSMDAGILRAAASEAKSAVNAARREIAAKARRQAVLAGLATLGYEVREGMATAWAKDGRIVIRKPNETDYGIELGGTSDLSRMQVQLVGSDHPASPRDSARDRNREVSWCSDFDRLKAVVASNGGELALERALAPGSQAVKTVSDALLAPGATGGYEIEEPKAKHL